MENTHFSEIFHLKIQEEYYQKLAEVLVHKKLSHCIALDGAPENGTFYLACKIALFLHCTDKKGTNPCYQCKNCLLGLDFDYPDTHFFFPTTTEQNAKYNEVYPDWKKAISENPFLTLKKWTQKNNSENKRFSIAVSQLEKIRSTLQYHHGASEKRVIVIWYPERIAANASNKLLKVLEEPPAGNHFILVTENTQHLLPTVLSRTTKYPIGNEPPEMFLKRLHSLSTLLEKEFNGEKEPIKTYGEYYDFIENQTLESEYFNFILQWLRACYSRKPELINQYSHDFSQLGREAMASLLFSFSELLQKCLYQKLGLPSSEKSLNEKNFIANFSALIEQELYLSFIQEVSSASFAIRRNGNSKLVFYTLSNKIVLLLQGKERYHYLVPSYTN